MIKARLEAFLADRKGGVIIYVALTMPVLVGGMGLGAETGYRYYNQRLLQHAADFAAHAGAVRKYKENNSNTNVEAAALNVATRSGFMSDIGILPVSHVPPTMGAFTGDPSAVEVILTETRPRLFSAIFSEEPVVIAARAVAAVTSLGQPACILALSGDASGAVTVTGSTDVNLTGCSVASNSTASDSFDMQGEGGYLTTDCVQATGGVDTTTNLTLTECDAPLTYSPPVADPYWWVMEPDASTIPCQTAYPGNNPQIGNGSPSSPVVQVTPSHTWTHPGGTVQNVMRFCSGTRLQNRVNFAPGIYIFDGGDLTINNGAIVTAEDPVTGLPNGVTFYFTNTAQASINGGAQLNLTAPEDGPYSGILFFGGRSDPDAHTISGNSSSTLTGAIYMPASKVTFTGNSVSGGGCTQVIANTIELTGNSGLASECEDDGTEEILVGHLISIVE